MGDLPSSSEPSLDQRLLLLERRLKEQHVSHQQQLTSFLTANASLREDNIALRNVAIALPRPATTPTIDQLDIPTTQRSPAQSESIDNFSCKTPENSNFLKKKSKTVILVKIQNFSRSRKTKRTSPLEFSRKI